jgi:4-amino-4-deoxy-L-arabinose transferase-like glycosyltransferase
MLFYERETLAGLLVASVPAIFSVYFFFIREKKDLAMGLLILSAFMLRLLMISLDPYVHEWDERFHALVAKNMMDHPFKPMLITNHIMAYDPHDWGYNHIWVHKQPLFLWQMALSMKIFGVSPIALRLPSAIMGTIMVWLIYDMGRKWIKDDTVAFLAAYLAGFAYYALEMISGWMSLEHNDLAFLFYMTCTFWAFTRYLHSDKKIKWSLLIGVFAGLAILNKWLVGLLIFGGFGLYLLLSDQRFNYKKYLQIGVAVLTACIVFGPWQLYILKVFPAESAIAFEYNRKHMIDSLGHPGNAFFHFNFLSIAYHKVLLGFSLIGLYGLFTKKDLDTKLSVSFVAMIVVIFSFFSFFVATKMPAFVYPVSSLIMILMALGVVTSARGIFNYLKIMPVHQKELFCMLTLLVGFYSLKPSAIIDQRAESNVVRNNKINNANVYRHLEDRITSEYVILNCRPYENIELMFYKDANAYHWYPDASTQDSLKQLGHKFAAFQYLNDPQQLPEFMTRDSTILILERGLK